MSSAQEGTGTINTTRTADFRGKKLTISCTATLGQDTDATELYTCGDFNSTGLTGALICDSGTGFGGVNVTNATTCNRGFVENASGTTNATSTATNAFGAFTMENHGSFGNLTKTLTSFSSGALSPSPGAPSTGLALTT